MRRSMFSLRRGAFIAAAIFTLGVTVPAATPAQAKGFFEMPRAELEAKYADAASRFVDIDGVRVHYKDEGTGPAVVLLHASYMNLHSWDGLAERLKRDHRVIRLDLLTAGLTGVDTKDLYSMERNEALLDGLLRKLDVKQYAVVGTSSGGVVAFRRAAAHPEEVTRLVLINSAGMPRTAATDPNRPRGTAWQQWWRSKYKSRAYWQENLERQFGSGVKPDPALVERVYDMNRREGINEEGPKYLRNFRTGDPETALAKVRAPTLVLWGIGNLTVSHLEADVFQLWLNNAPSIKKKYPKLGHYPYLEAPDLVLPDVVAFLNGEWDAQLRVTRRLPPN
jgi:pimeloyl-ACP methyl ester carboxylesterase